MDAQTQAEVAECGDPFGCIDEEGCVACFVRHEVGRARGVSVSGDSGKATAQALEEATNAILERVRRRD